MATIKTFTASTETGAEIGGVSAFQFPGAAQRYNSQQNLGFHLMHYASDGTAISLLLKNINNASYGLQAIVASDGLTPTSANAKASDTIDLSTYGSGTTFRYTTFGDINQNFALPIPFAIDSSDNLYVFLLRDGNTAGTYGGSTVLKISKPTEGWASWELGTNTSLRVSLISSENYTVFPGNQTTNTASGALPQNVYATYVCEGLSDGIPYLVTFYSNININSGSYNGAITYEVRNLNTGARTAQGNITAGNNYFGVNSMAQARANAAGGAFTYWSYSSTTTQNGAQTWVWQIRPAGLWSATSFSTHSYLATAPSFNENIFYGNYGLVQFVNKNRFILVGRSGSGTSYIAAMMGVNWRSPVDNYDSSTPGQGGSTPLFQSYGSVITVSGTGGTYAAMNSTTNTFSLTTFPENNFFRIINHSRGGYYDMNYSTSSGVSSTLNANSYAWDDALPNSMNGIIPGPAYDNKLLYIYSTDGSSTLSFRYLNHSKDNVITYSAPSIGPAASSLISAPTATSINSNGGIKLDLVRPSGSVSTTGHGSTYWGRFTPSVIGYKLRRVDGATTTYLTDSTLSFGESEVNNNLASTVFTSASLDIPSAQWANTKNYDLSFAYNYTTANTSVYGATRTLSTVTPGTAPTTATAKRFMRRALPTFTDAHEYTFDNNALINRINIANYGAQATVAIKIAGIYLIPPTTIAGGAVLNIDTSQRVDQNDRIFITSSSSSVDIWISGTEGI